MRGGHCGSAAADHLRLRRRAPAAVRAVPPVQPRPSVPPPYAEGQSLRSLPTWLSDSRVPVGRGVGAPGQRVLHLKADAALGTIRSVAEARERGVLQIKRKPLGGAPDQGVRQINPAPGRELQHYTKDKPWCVEMSVHHKGYGFYNHD